MIDREVKYLVKPEVKASKCTFQIDRKPLRMNWCSPLESSVKAEVNLYISENFELLFTAKPLLFFFFISYERKFCIFHERFPISFKRCLSPLQDQNTSAYQKDNVAKFLFLSQKSLIKLFRVFRFLQWHGYKQIPMKRKSTKMTDYRNIKQKFLHKNKKTPPSKEKFQAYIQQIKFR